MLNFYVNFSRSEKCLGILIIIFITLAFVLPVECSYENHFLENLELVVLIIGIIVSIVKIKIYNSKIFTEFYIGCICIYAILFSRELSWGRVFYPIGFRENGEEIYVDLENLFYGDIVYPMVAIIIFIAISCFAYVFYQGKKLRIKCNIPLIETSIFILMSVLSQCIFEKEVFLCLQDYNELLEECTENLAYITIVFANYKTFFVK